MFIFFFFSLSVQVHSKSIVITCSLIVTITIHNHLKNIYHKNNKDIFEGVVFVLISVCKVFVYRVASRPQEPREYVKNARHK